MKKTILLLAAVIINLLPLSAKAEETKPLSHIDTDCLFTYHFAYRAIGYYEYKKTYRFDKRTVDDKEYLALIECDEKGDYDKETTNNVYAYLREEDNKVYMLLGNAQKLDWTECVYGMTDKETMIYDYSLEPGESYRIGELDDYFILPENPTSEEVQRWIMDNYFESPYIYLALWDHGSLTLRDKRFDQELGREVWTYAQKYFNPLNKYNLLLLDEPTWDAEGRRTFDVIDGFGCMQSLVTFPGLFPPCPTIVGAVITPTNPILCKVQRIDTKEILFERTDLPHPPLVEELDADGNTTPKYFNIQGMPVSNPTEGEIYIVKRGSKATKEVYRR